MKMRLLPGQLFLLSIILISCSSGGVTIEVQDEIVENVE